MSYKNLIDTHLSPQAGSAVHQLVQKRSPTRARLATQNIHAYDRDVERYVRRRGF